MDFFFFFVALFGIFLTWIIILAWLSSNFILPCFSTTWFSVFNTYFVISYSIYYLTWDKWFGSKVRDIFYGNNRSLAILSYGCYNLFPSILRNDFDVVFDFFLSISGKQGSNVTELILFLSHLFVLLSVEISFFICYFYW